MASNSNKQRSSLWAVKIHIPYDKPNFSLSYDTLITIFSTFAYILHDKDESDEPLGSGQSTSFKPKHYHIVGKSYSRTYFNPIKKKLMLLYDLPDNVITVDKVLSLTSCLRYLIHLDDLDKYQYPINSVHTNNATWLYSNLCISEQLFTEYILSVLRASLGNYEYVLKTLGVANCRRYHSIIYMYFRLYYKSNFN